MNEPVRILQAWLADPTNGAQAELANVARDGSDPEPTAIVGVLDETTSAIIAQGRIPKEQATPLLFVWQFRDVVWSEENQGSQDAPDVEVAIAYLDRDDNAEVAVRDSGYYLRAVKRSVIRLNRGANLASRTRNNVQLIAPYGMRLTRPGVEVEQAYVSRVLAVTYTVRDNAP